MDLTTAQKRTVLAAYLGWTLDAFDFFLLTFVIKDIAKEFGVGVPEVAYALFLTLATRFVGAFVFGRIGDKWGRKPALMLDIVCYSVIGAAAAFSPNLTIFLVLRALFGVAMGGEWGLGSSLAMESIPPQARGIVSGILQCGYPSGFLLASVAYGLLYGRTFGDFTFGWRPLFLLSVLPAFVTLFIRAAVPESPAFEAAQKVEQRAGLWETIQANWGLVLYSVVLMMAFNLFSHGTQDLYPTFLQHDMRRSAAHTGLIVAVANIGALLGGICCGSISERFGRRRTIVFAALLAIPMVPLWAWSHTATMLAVGGFLMQFMVQGAWGIIPAHLNELAPAPVRAILPGFAYQLGNLLSSRNQIFQQVYADRHNAGSLNVALSATVVVVAITVATVAGFGPEAKGADLIDAE